MYSLHLLCEEDALDNESQHCRSIHMGPSCGMSSLAGERERGKGDGGWGEEKKEKEKG